MIPRLAVVVFARVLVGPQALISLLLVSRWQGSNVHHLADLADVPACEVRERLGLPLIAVAELLPVGGRCRTFILAGPGRRGAARPSFLLAEAPR